MIKALLVLGVLLAPALCRSDVPTVYYDGRPLDIPVAMGKVTEVIFPQKVARIVKGGGVDSILVEVMGSSVFLLPKNEDPADIFVTSVKGESYPLNLLIGIAHQAKVRVAYAFDPKRSSSNARSDVMDLMKLLMQGRVPAGATVLEGSQNIRISENNIELTLETVFDLPKLNGLIMKARNLTDHTLILPVQAIGYPRLLAISADVDSLSAQGLPGDSSAIYMVTGK